MALICMWAMLVPVLTHAAGDESITAHLHALIATLPPPAQEALAQMPSLERRLLAARTYAKTGEGLQSRWSWTEEQIRSFQSSAEHRAMLDAIDAVTRQFEVRNPGYSLFANTQVRTLAAQLERWNSNAGVGAVAMELHRHLAREMRGIGHPAAVDAQSLRRFSTLLTNWRPPVAAPLAAPGLSAHGQSRAIDFQIVDGTQVIAGPEVASVAQIWRAQGWDRRLQQAVQASGAPFAGPLQSPGEPWHYEYLP